MGENGDVGGSEGSEDGLKGLLLMLLNHLFKYNELWFFLAGLILNYLMAVLAP